jgi:hypothetical protein
MVADPPSASHWFWLPLVFQYGARVWTCPPDVLQYCSCSAVAPAEAAPELAAVGRAAVGLDTVGLDAVAEPDPPVEADPRVAGELDATEAALLLAAALVPAVDPLDPHPDSSASTNTDVTATGAAAAVRVRLVLIAAPLPWPPLAGPSSSRDG